MNFYFKLNKPKMKKLFLSAMIICLSVFYSHAQITDTPDYLPEEGDFGIGINGTPILNFVGNLFSDTHNNLNLSEQNLHFRYFLSDDAALRTQIGIGLNSNTTRILVRDDAAFIVDPRTDERTVDYRTTTNQSHSLMIGYQLFRGERRLRGFYGADLGIAYSKTTLTYEYGNEMTANNPTPTTAWAYFITRPLQEKRDPVTSLSLGAFTGGEYYLIPQLCIGLEVGLMYSHGFGRRSTLTFERVENSQRIEETRDLTAGSRSFNIGARTPYMYGNFYFMFHF
jgi:hypothetical protein